MQVGGVGGRLSSQEAVSTFLDLQTVQRACSRVAAFVQRCWCWGELSGDAAVSVVGAGVSSPVMQLPR